MQMTDDISSQDCEIDDWTEGFGKSRQRPSRNRSEKQYEVCFRCPHCQKLYKTDSNVFEGEEAQFDCSICERTFLLKNIQDTFGLFITAEQQRRSFSTCPKCSSLKPKNSDECPLCGIFASKFIEAQKAESPLLFELNQQWQKVLLNFDQDQYHQDFINKCHVKLALNFAFQKYSDLQKTIGFDSLCKKYINQIDLRMVQQLKNKENSEQVKPVVSVVQISLMQYIFMCLGAVGLLMLIYNKFFPTFPNFNGLVTVFTVLTLGIGLFSKSGSKSDF